MIGRPCAKIDSNFFRKRNKIAAYWAGFIAADGCIHNDKIISVEIHYMDRTQIFKLSHALKYEGNIFERRENKKFSRLTFVSKNIVKDLARIYNIYPRKSFTLKPPNLNRENDIRAFIRGFMDGDGSIYLCNPKFKRWAISFNGTEDILKWIKKNIKKYVQNTIDPNIIYNDPIYKLTFTGEQSLYVLNWLYKSSNAWTRLDRKCLKYSQVKQQYELSLRQQE